MSYYHSLKRLSQGWWKQLQENWKKKKEKRRRKSQSIWDTERPLETPKCREQEQLRCPSTCWPSQALLCCSSTTLQSEAYSDLLFSYCGTDSWLHSANFHMCITPLKLHSLTNDKVHKGIRHCTVCSMDHLFSAVSTWGSEKLVLSKTLSDTSDNTTHKHNVI